LELKRIKEMMAMMRRSKTRKLRIKDKDFEIELEMESPHEERTIVQTVEHRPLAKHGKANADIPPSISSLHPVADKGATEKAGNYVTSPMVGTFYGSPSPDEPPFVKVGDKVTPQTVVCIIEAMKVMNEVKANTTGTVTEVLVENGHPVEFGSKLILIS
jgi:acetyl-CoA carboxylase biotin carboxyl carrier protein